jgi:predicted nucleic acid-binding protein
VTVADAPREFVDANVFVYAEDASAGVKRRKASDLLARLWEARGGCLSVQVLQEFFVTVTQKVPKPMSADAAEERVRDLSRWTVFAPTARDVLSAIAVARRHRLSFWDAMIVEGAVQLGCTTLWTEDLQDGSRLSGVTIRNPFS